MRWVRDFACESGCYRDIGRGTLDVDVDVDGGRVSALHCIMGRTGEEVAVTL